MLCTVDRALAGSERQAGDRGCTGGGPPALEGSLNFWVFKGDLNLNFFYKGCVRCLFGLAVLVLVRRLVSVFGMMPAPGVRTHLVCDRRVHGHQATRRSAQVQGLEVP